MMRCAIVLVKMRRPKPGAQLAKKADACVPMLVPERALGFPARVAEFLLVLRLRARRRSALSAAMLERALQVVFVTCQHWFGAGSLPQRGADRSHEGDEC